MANPQVLGPDNILRSEVDFSTSLLNRFVTGTLPEEAIDAQVSINGSAFSSEPDLIQWGDGEWVVPSPLAEPNGLELLPGGNVIRVRATLPAGGSSPEAVATIRLITDASVGVVAAVPTNIGVEQKNNSVTIRAESSSTTGFQGMNFYASLNAGGGITGYTRINVELITEGTATPEESSFGTLDVHSAVYVDPEDQPLADPLYFRLTGQQRDEQGNAVSPTGALDFDQSFEVPEEARDLRIQATLSSVRDVIFYSFSHNRSAGPASTPPTVQIGDFSSLPNETPLYYVVTAVFFDSDRNLEYESSFSEEVVARPLSVTTALGSFPSVSRQEIVQSFITAIFRSNPQVKVEAGSVLRDTVINPFSSESERLRFILDFYHRARTPTLLLQIDDPNGTGISLPVFQSPYKQALQNAFYLESAQEVQDLIDQSFEAYARGFGIIRRAGTPAQGEATFYTTRRPTGTIPVPLGTISSGGGIQFATTREASIPFESLASYFDPVSGRYQITVSVRAVSPGSSGNIGVGQLRTLVSSLGGGVSVINAAAMTGGRDRESNLELTERVLNALASVDSGTKQGYLQTAADVAGVIKANVVEAGNELMQRDLDENGVHKGGKVDVWVQGENISTVTDTFAFQFDIAQNIQFEVIGNPANYEFRAIDPMLTISDPIVEMLDDPASGYELRNASTGDVYDLTDVTITSYNTIQLSTSIPQPPLTLTNIVLGSYFRRTGNTFVLPRQPVGGITSVVGAVSGELPEDAYLLERPNAPLDIGRSQLAGDFLRILGFVDDDGNQVPNGASIPVTDEPHVMVGAYPEFLDNRANNFLSIQVWNQAKTVEYVQGVDYSLSLGSETSPVSITRIEATTSIADGQTVLVDYTHDENFTVTYTVNLISSLTQEAIDAKKHSTADVLVKEAVPVPLDLTATIVLKRGRDRATVDTAVRTNLENFFANLRLGDPVRQSDLIDVLEDTEGVSYVIIPVTKMVRAEGSQVVREVISTDTASESTQIPSLSTNVALVWILNNELQAATVDGGGSAGDFKAVFQNDFAMELLDGSVDLVSLGVRTNRAYIIGSEGRAITGFSDDSTLMAQGYVTSSAIEAQRVALTANRVVVSLAVGDSPPQNEYAATYIVGQDFGAKNIDPGDAEYCTGGEFMFTYDEDR